MLGALLALSSSIVWGCCDFAGGVLARRFAVLAIIILSHAAGAGALACASLVADIPFDRDAFGVGLLAGLAGAISAASFYRAMALGLVSVASPLLAFGSVVAFALAVAAGERPSTVAFLGAPVALAGVVLVSFGGRDSRSGRRSAVGYALVAASTLGVYLFVVGRASDGGSSVSAVFGARVGALGVLVLLGLVVRPPVPKSVHAWAVAGLIGVGGSGAFVLFGYAADLTLISVASILSSLYPLVTVLLARSFLKERLRTTQFVGVVLALAGVVLVALG